MPLKTSITLKDLFMELQCANNESGASVNEDALRLIAKQLYSSERVIADKTAYEDGDKLRQERDNMRHVLGFMIRTSTK